MKLKAFILLFISLLLTYQSYLPDISITRLDMKLLSNTLLNVIIEVKNNQKRPITELGGYLELLDKNQTVIDKQFLKIVHLYDDRLKMGAKRKREIVISYDPSRIATVRYRITSVKLYGEDETYLLCPHCGRLIKKD